MNQKIRSLENALMDTLNASDVPTEIKRIILGKVEAQMTILANKDILTEIDLEKEKEVSEQDAEST